MDCFIVLADWLLYLLVQKGLIMTPEQFKEARNKMGVSQDKMAALLGLNSGRAVRAYELGERKISGPVMKLMEIFSRNFKTETD